MSEIRDELERNFASVGTQSEEVEKSNVVEEQPQSQEPAVIDEWMDAPKAYTKEFQDTFKELSPKWREYLTGREKQVERGFSDLGNKVNGYKWIDDIYSSRQDRLGKMGITKAQDYFNSLTQLDDAMDKDPRSTLMALAQAYGVDFNDNNNAYNSLQNQFFDLQKQLKIQQEWIAQSQQQKYNQDFNDFTNAKDDNGNLRHPYWQDVRQEMINLLNTGSYPTLEDAYNSAIWLNADVRDKMMADQAKAKLDTKIVEANKAKQAGFSPKSKNIGEEKELSLREELERRFGEI